MRQLSLWEVAETPTGSISYRPTPVTWPFGTRQITHQEMCLQTSLALAVPLEIAQIRRYHGQPTDYHLELCLQISDKIAGPGIEDLMFADTRSKRGRAASMFADLAWALAVAAYMPGGVNFVGLHFEAQPAPPIFR